MTQACDYCGCLCGAHRPQPVHVANGERWCERCWYARGKARQAKRNALKMTDPATNDTKGKR